MRYKKEEFVGMGGVSTTTYYLYSGNEVLFEETFVGDVLTESKFNVINNGQIVAQFKNA